MAGIILLAFILVPIAEIAVFIEAGKWIGLWPTLGVIVLTALVGAAMLRQQGLRVLAQTQEKLGRGEMPVGELFSGLCLLVAGALLLTPGFLTDTVGFALLIPPLRDALGYFVLRRLVRNPQSRAWVNGEEIDLGGGGGARRPADNTVIEGDYTDVTDGPDTAPPSDDSPWRRD
ncbi:MAG: FxsA family protein [Alphaproteobacteria bacterium]|nr:FxsA family protein [Alphaproteobacteria bacterium]